MTEPAAEPVGPILAAGLWAEVVAAAYDPAHGGPRCQCAGQCGRTHQKDGGRCARLDHPGDPLHAVPREDTGPIEAMVLEAGELIALCDRCHGGVLTRRRSTARKAAQAELAAGPGLWP